MISEGYEKALFELPVSDRYLLAESSERTAPCGSIRVITKEFDFLRDLRRAVRVVKRVVDSDETLFEVVERRHPKGMLAIQSSRLGWLFMHIHHVTQEEMELHFPMHGFNPYVDLLFKARKEVLGDVDLHDDWTRARGPDATSVAARLNAFVAHLRKKAGAREFEKVLGRLRRRCDKNTRSMRKYLDAIFQHRGGRHLVIRLDLGYAMDGAWAAARPTTISLKQAKEDMAKFQRYLRDHLPVTGFAAKLEYGLLRGYHFHALILLNGDLMQKDVLIAKMLGEHWKAVICEGQGTYWNCNAEEYVHRGIGMIHYSDGDKRIALVEWAASYLTKNDFWLHFQPGGKVFFKGLMPQPRPKRGRPREYED